MRLVECVPNFSEGRDRAKVDAIVQAAKSVDGVRVLDIEMDKDHHRSVLSFVASPEAAVEAAFRAAEKAKELIDLTVHRGEHPRMGATDVIPFIPVAGVTMDNCVNLARKLGERMGRELGIPVYLYGLAAARPERRDLAAVRKGQFEGLRSAIENDPDRKPDYGPTHIHPTAGATAVGAREQIVNFNVNLSLTDLEAGKTIAKKIRTSGGGLPELRAKEIQLSTGNIQISTVLTDYKKTSLWTVFEAVRREASAHRSEVIATEIVGLIPRQVLANCATEALRLKDFSFEGQILEEKLTATQPIQSERARNKEVANVSISWDAAAAVVAKALSTTDATPGGGSAAAIAGAMGAGLAQMAAGISLQSKKLDPAKKPALERAVLEFAQARERFLKLGIDDASAFEAVMAALKIPKDRPDRKEALQKALQGAAEAPMATVRLAVQHASQALASLAFCADSVASDMRCAAELLRSAARCAAENVKINTQSLIDKNAASSIEKELQDLLGRVT